MELRFSSLFYACVIFLSGSVCGLQITSSGPASVEKASGETVTLECKFTLAAEDNGPLDIEWSIQPSDNQKEEKVLILYSGDRVYENYYPPLQGRVHFVSSDPKNGDASITVMALISSDTGTYQCKVKKAPGIGSQKVLLTVMVRPSKPRCSIEGSPYVGNDVVLRCKSTDGTSPIQYAWVKTSDSKLLPANAVLDAAAGTVKIRNATTAVSGSYLCTAQNRVGAEQCVLELKITTPPNTAGVIAGSVIGVLLFLLLLALLLFCCCRSRQKKKYEKEISYEIREDVPAPKSRISTARSFTSAGSQRSSLGSMSPSNLHEYTKTQYNKIPSEEYEAPPSHVPDPPPSLTPVIPVIPPSRVAGPNLSRMGAVPVMTPAQNRDGSIV
ncbi:coxsackievirus and adenovirus receptor homolog [Ictalurus furcatus]|uniref:coxsackievirus and adenovirus receptor homolog n=1 Tax=Ictalurus furcatus TaxID=66913 RepID=UPI00234FC408|nr:coxsackievirus and adenovirus receptor homolog [Ictalurus furcatus]